MNYSSFTTPPGQRVSSFSLPSSAAHTSTSSTAVDDVSPPTLTNVATPEPSSSMSLNSPPPAQQELGREPSRIALRHRSVYNRLRRHYNQGILRWLLVLVALLVSLQLYVHLRSLRNDDFSALRSGWASEIPHLHLSKRKRHDPIQWLKENSSPNDLRASRPKAALISLVRNEELDGILQSMQQLEFHWNGRYNYPWVFFNEKPFSEEFKVRPLSILIQSH